jgi:hypothetical protein
MHGLALFLWVGLGAVMLYLRTSQKHGLSELALNSKSERKVPAKIRVYDKTMTYDVNFSIRLKGNDGT